MVRYGLFDNFDAWLRRTTAGIHADGKYQFLNSSSGWDGSVSVRVSHHSFNGTTFDVLKNVDIEEFSRNDVEVPLLFGKKLGLCGRSWGGPKYIFASCRTERGSNHTREYRPLRRLRRCGIVMPSCDALLRSHGALVAAAKPAQLM